MLDKEQTLKLELVRIIAITGIPPEEIKDSVIPFFEWILGSHHSRPCSTGDKA